MSKKILIIGNSTKAYALAKFLSKNNKVFVSSNSDSIKEFATCLDIREDATSELLEFVLENDIDITIPVSEKTLNTNLVEILTNNNQAVFAPTKNVTNLIFDKSAIKKILYKLNFFVILSEPCITRFYAVSRFYLKFLLFIVLVASLVSLASNPP